MVLGRPGAKKFNLPPTKAKFRVPSGSSSGLGLPPAKKFKPLLPLKPSLTSSILAEHKEDLASASRSLSQGSSGQHASAQSLSQPLPKNIQKKPFSLSGRPNGVVSQPHSNQGKRKLSPVMKPLSPKKTSTPSKSSGRKENEDDLNSTVNEESSADEDPFSEGENNDVDINNNNNNDDESLASIENEPEGEKEKGGREEKEAGKDSDPPQVKRPPCNSEQKKKLHKPDGDGIKGSKNKTTKPKKAPKPRKDPIKKKDDKGKASTTTSMESIYTKEYDSSEEENEKEKDESRIKSKNKKKKSSKKKSKEDVEPSLEQRHSDDIPSSMDSSIKLREESLLISRGGPTRKPVKEYKIKGKYRKIIDAMEKEREKGTYVECVNCKKWRYLRKVLDPSTIPDIWTCSDNPDPRYNSCSVPEVNLNVIPDDEWVENHFTSGSIVWAKIGETHLWWPAMIDDDPDTGKFCWIEESLGNEPMWYHVLFFNRYEDLVARSWIKTELVEPFESSGPSSSFQDKNSYHQQQAVKEANRASELSLKERRKKYGYIFRYKGFWNLPWDKKLWKKEDGPTASAMSADESETESGRGGDVRGSSLAEEGGMGELELYREPSCVSNGENEPEINHEQVGNDHLESSNISHSIENVQSENNNESSVRDDDAKEENVNEESSMELGENQSEHNNGSSLMNGIEEIESNNDNAQESSMKLGENQSMNINGEASESSDDIEDSEISHQEAHEKSVEDVPLGFPSISQNAPSSGLSFENGSTVSEIYAMEKESLFQGADLPPEE